MFKKKWRVTFLPDMILLDSYRTKWGALREIKRLVDMGVSGKDLELTEVIYESMVE